MPTPLSSSTLAHLQASFVALVLPRVLSHGRVCFRDVACPHRRQDAIQEMIGLAWKWHLRLAEQRKDATHFPTALASYAARAVQCGCRLPGQDRANDVLSPRAQRQHDFAIVKLPKYDTLSDNPLSVALADNTKSPLNEVVCFKLDFLAWLTRLSERDRGIVLDLMLGERTRDVAAKHGLSAARISQKRREFCHDCAPRRQERRIARIFPECQAA